MTQPDFEPEGEPWPEILAIALILAASLIIPACSIWAPQWRPF
jgi:hypothetical protein